MCDDVLQRDCGDDMHKGATCFKCVEVHRDDLEKAKCDREDVEEFCAPHPPPPHNGTCEEVLAHDCGGAMHKGEECAKCVEEHREDIERAHCEPDDIRHFCESPEAICFEELERDCGHMRDNATHCAACTKEHAADLEKAHCTTQEVTEFCHPAPQV